MKKSFTLLVALFCFAGLFSQEHYLGEEYLGGIVYYTFKDAKGDQHGLIVSKTETIAKWQNKGKLTGANRSWDGYYNMGLMTDSPAKDWITTNFSSEWYLPSIDELNILWQNRFHVNKTLFNLNATLLSSSVAYLSSTEVTNKFGDDFAFIFGFDTGYIFSNYKAKEYSVRAIRAF
jgi:hypothetical protein